jgi:hypothetical protein
MTMSRNPITSARLPYSKSKLRACILLLVLSGVARADDAADLARAAKSPIELAQFVKTHTAFDWEPLWEALHSKSHLFLGPCEAIPDHGCTTELIDIPDPKQTILVIFDGRDAAVYLCYRGSASRWTFEGAFSPDTLRAAPEHHVTSIGKRPLLRVIAAQPDGRPTDQEEIWIDLTARDFKVVFGFAPTGRRSEGAGVSCEWQTKVDETKPGEREEIHLTQTTTYWLDQPDGKLPLGEKTEALVFGRSSTAAFTDITGGAKGEQARKDRVARNRRGPDPARLLREDLEGLKAVASGPDSPQKTWLREFLKDAPTIRERGEIEALLAGQSPKL